MTAEAGPVRTIAGRSEGRILVLGGTGGSAHRDLHREACQFHTAEGL